MKILTTRIISAGVLNCWVALAGILASPNAENTTHGPQTGRPWSVPLSVEASLDLGWIPPGTFTMGSPATEPGRKADESPQTEVTLTRGFWLGKTFVTVGQWKKVMGVDVRGQLVKHINDDTLYDFGGKKQTLRDLMRWSRDADPSVYLGNEGENLPMYFVSWDDAMEFSKKLTERERATGRLPVGYEFNLPTEAQWEYACRAGTTAATYAGPNSEPVLEKIAWYGQNSAAGYTGRPLGTRRSGPRDVGQKEPNAWGL